MFKYIFFLSKSILKGEEMEKDIRKTRTCERCKAVVPLENVKLFPKDKNINMLVCENCSQELNKPKLVSRIKASPSAEYKNYRCIRCRYSFKIDTSKIGTHYNLKCPYCGKDDRLQQN